MLNEDHTFGLEYLDSTQQQANFFFETSKQAISCLHYTVHTGRNPNGTQNSTLRAERAHATTKRSFPAHYTTQADSTIHPWPISPYHKRPGPGSPTERFPRARVACTQPPCISLASSPVSFRSRPRAPDSACLSPPTRRRGARQPRVSPPAGHVEARCVRLVVSSLPPLAIGWDPVGVSCRLVGFFRSRGF
jgi:hypothetical protein